MQKWFIIFYDGECGFCSRSVMLILALDRKDMFRFAPLQGNLAKAHLNTSLFDRVDTLVLMTPDEQCQIRFEAVRTIISKLPLPWNILSFFLYLLPQTLGDFIYNIVAKNRDRFFSKKACRLLKNQDQSKFLN